jgi:hypothetical protein
MVELGDSAAKFTVSQMENAVDIFMDPGRAIDRTRRSLNNFSDAMYRSARREHYRHEHEMDTQKDLTGDRHTEGRHQSSDTAEREAGHHATNGHQGASHAHQEERKKHTGHTESSVK